MACDASSRCWREEYGDPADPMGSAWPNSLERNLVCTNAPQVNDGRLDGDD